MAKLIWDERIGRGARLSVGASALIFDPEREKILLTRRSDNGRWCLPGGAMDAGESAQECCEREVFEETGLHVRATRLVGVYSDPNLVLEYADGNRVQVVALHFEAEVIRGELGLSDETTEVGYFTLAEIETMDVMEHHGRRIADTLTNQVAAFVR
jgi:8-oxo-dGTP pyrophosphatase MutT (NUDIX family)